MSEHQTERITHQFRRAVQISDDNRFDRLLIPVLLAIGILYSGVQLLSGDVTLAIVSGFSVVLLLAFAAFNPLHTIFLRRPFDRHHAVYIALFWAYSLLWVTLFRQLSVTPAIGKDSRFFYVLLILFLAATFRTLLTLFALTPIGYAVFITRIPIWERLLVAVNELIAAGLLAFVAGGELARLVQPQTFTIRVDVTYSTGLLSVLIAYYLVMQVMWIQRWNDWLSRHTIWVRLARLFAPIALIVASMVVTRHFARLSDPRTADLLGTANLDQTVLALSPIIWLMILAVVILVYTSSRGLRKRFLPDRLLQLLSPRMRTFFSSISDMDILLIVGFFATVIPVQFLLLDGGPTGILGTLQQQIAQQNALIDSSSQALSVLFALPFYLLAVGLLALYGFVMANPELSAKDRDDLVDRLPIGLLIVFIITLYLGAVPFSQVLTEGRIPQLPQELGRVLAFDVLIPLLLLYGHYFLLVRYPYGRGQSRWRKIHSDHLDESQNRIQRQIDTLDSDILRIEQTWNAWGRHASSEDRISTLYHFVELNGKRDQRNMELLGIVNDKQQLAEISEAPVSVTIARLPTRIVSLGIPLLIVFKLYEWAVVNDGLREIANNPNIGVIEFFQTILEQAQF